MPWPSSRSPSRRLEAICSHAYGAKPSSTQHGQLRAFLRIQRSINTVEATWAIPTIMQPSKKLELPYSGKGLTADQRSDAELNTP